MTDLVAVLWTLLVLAAGTLTKPRPVRRPAAACPPPPTRPPKLLVETGRRVHHLADAASRAVGRPLRPCTDHRHLARIGLLSLATVAGLAVSVPMVLTAWLLGTVHRRVAVRRAADRRLAVIRRELPEAVELLAIAISSGANLTQAIDITVASLDGVVADALRAARAATDVGLRMIDALRIVPEHLGEAAQPLVTALVLAERHGTPLVQALRQLAVELRNQRRRHAEEAARRVPIRLLAPLVLLLLPAFALLTVAPLLAGGLRSLRL